MAIPSAKLRTGLAEAVHFLLIGRLAVDAAFQGQGLGSALLVDALRRCARAAAIAGACGVIVHANDDEAVHFYQRHGFTAAPPLGVRTMLLPTRSPARDGGLANFKRSPIHPDLMHYLCSTTSYAPSPI